jgi:uroporphyrinogen decarboxylase
MATAQSEEQVDMTDREMDAKVTALLADMRKNGGLAPLELDEFWRKQGAAMAAPFSEDIEQCPFGATLTWECVFDELGVEQDWWRFQYQEPAWGAELCRRYNDKAEKMVGRRILPEKMSDPSRRWPQVKELHDIFEAENVWEGGAAGSWWLKQSAFDEASLAALLDRVEARLEKLRDFMLPPEWESEKARLSGLGLRVPLYRGQRGPCTFACSIYGAENLLMLYYDNPDLLRRFSDVLARAILARAAVLDGEAEAENVARAKHWSWADDNCCLFSPEMFEFFAMPIHRAVFGQYAPEPNNHRYQHSDSAMGHLLPLLSELDLRGVNFGPTLRVRDIRQHCPRAVIQGQLAPFTYSRNDEEGIVREFLRDFAEAREQRGLVFATAGSINNGSRLTGMRLIMAAIQRYGQF